MNLYICGLYELHQYEDKKITHIISIHADKNNADLSGFATKNILRLKFDDITQNREGFVTPTWQDINAIIQFASTFQADSNVLIHCHAGVSRSAAAGYIVKCLELNDPQKALDAVLSVRPHIMPNELMVFYAASILKNHEIYMVFEKWRIKELLKRYGSSIF